MRGAQQQSFAARSFCRRFVASTNRIVARSHLRKSPNSQLSTLNTTQQHQHQTTNSRVAQADAVGPKSGGATYFEKLSQDASFIKPTGGDPAGFTIIDVLAWGALGHAVAFAFLGAQSCGAGCIPGFQ